MERMRITIAGMSCGGCVNSVRYALNRVPGLHVEEVEVGSAVVSYDPGVTTPELINSAIIKAGFEPWASASQGSS
jgi:copper chaperone